MTLAIRQQFRGWTALCATVLLVACGGGGGGSSTGSTTDSSAGTITGDTISGDNVLPVIVDSGPLGVTNRVNTLYADVTVCVPGTTTCQTLDHVLVDTGSVGLRVVYSALDANMRNLTRVKGDTGNPLLNCVNFGDNSFAWGAVVTADVKLGGKTASGIPIQVIADPLSGTTAGGYSSAKTACNTSASGITEVSNATNSRSALGAKGILGIGNLVTDCGSYCATYFSSFRSGSVGYYECTTTSAGVCSAVGYSTASLTKQLQNPVPHFSGDNNGLVVVLPAVTPSNADRAGTLTGSVVFGIDTRANNQSTGYTALKLDSTYGNYLIASLNGGSALYPSFLDTGSNGIFFNTTLTTGGTGFYIPASQTAFSVQLDGYNGNSKTFSFNVKSPAFATGYSVYPMLAGTMPSGFFANGFDGGLPFFFGRKVFVGIAGSGSSNLGTPPYYGL